MMLLLMLKVTRKIPNLTTIIMQLIMDVPFMVQNGGDNAAADDYSKLEV